MKLHYLRDLLAVAEKGSIRSASRHLGQTQPALSRSLRDLEQELGVPLLERHTRGIALTALGEVFSRRAGAALQEINRAIEEIQQLQGSMQGHITACFSSLSHVTLLPMALPAFRKRHPLIELRIIEGVYPVIERRLLDGSMDFYIGPQPISCDIAVGLQQEKLFDNSRVVLARKNHPARSATSLRELTNAQWISTSVTADPTDEYGSLFTSLGLPPPDLALQTETLFSWLIALTTTDLLAISPERYLEAPLIAGQVIQIPIKESLPGIPVVLIQRGSIPLTPAAEYFVDLLRRAALRHT